MSKPGLKLLVVGLGNITHPLTRHSVGHFIVDSLAERLGIPLSYASNLNGFLGQNTVRLVNQDASIALFKPKPLMNISGPPVSKAVKATVLDPNYVVVIHDSLSHRPCFISHTFGGSPQGHNGVKSVIASLNGANVHRLRIGIGRGEGSVADYVLGRLPSFEKEYWGVDGEGIDPIIRELERISQLPRRS